MFTKALEQAAGTLDQSTRMCEYDDNTKDCPTDEELSN